MFCSTVIPTLGRPSLARAVNSVLDQGFPRDKFEIIVVNDSGESLPQYEWRASVVTLNTSKHERSVARNTGAAIATGRYLHFLDDDDWIAPGTLQRFWDFTKTRDAAWYYGSSQLVTRQGSPILKLQHDLPEICFIQTLAGEWIPLQASLIDARAFFDVGGFNPRISGPEDIDLLRRIALKHNIAGMPEVVAFIERGEEGSSTDYVRHPEMSRWAREKIFESPGVYNRMRVSATSSYWSGRLVRAYLTSSLWNLRHIRPLIATSRFLWGMLGFVMAGSEVISSGFWQAVLRPYASETFTKGIRELKAFG